MYQTMLDSMVRYINDIFSSRNALSVSMDGLSCQFGCELKYYKLLFNEDNIICKFMEFFMAVEFIYLTE